MSQIRVRVIKHKIETDSYGYPKATSKIESEFCGRLLAILANNGKIVYVVARDDNNEIEEVIHETWVKIQMLSE